MSEDAAEELIKNTYDLGDYAFADIEFSDWENAEGDESFWNVSLHLRSSDKSIGVGTCWFNNVDKEVSFYVDLEEIMEMISKEVGFKMHSFVLNEFGKTINPELNVQVFGRDYT
tara:strand:+ start:1559 stop:1900 length:342 start_codon:yes stop_codon:yes gene_type:complete